MGTKKNVGFNKYPKQGKYLNQKIQVCFNYDLNNILIGTVIRNDTEEPFETIIMLKDGRIIRDVECMWLI